MDWLMWSIDQTLREMGLSGFDTQTLVWLDGRLNVDRFRAALERLNRAYPIVTARLAQEGNRPFWRSRPGAELPLHEEALESSERSRVLQTAARLFATPRSLEMSDPIAFLLWHLPDGRDVLALRYNHLLMDNNAANLLLRELNRDPSEPIDPALAALETADLMGDYVGGFSRARRLRAALRMINLRLRKLRLKPVLLRSPDATGRATAPAARQPWDVRILTRELSVEESAALRRRVVEVCRFPALSMALLASVFRTVQVLAMPDPERKNFIAGIGIDLGLRSGDGPIFQNLVSVLPIAAQPEELADHASLVRRLNEQLRERLQTDCDLGVLELTDLSRHLPGFFRKSTGGLLKNNYSVWYAWFGAAGGAADSLCGTPISDVRYIGPAWPPLGLTLLGNEFQGRMQFQATCLPDLVPVDLAEQFLDFVLADLRAFASSK